MHISYGLIFDRVQINKPSIFLILIVFVVILLPHKNANAQVDPGLVELHQWYNPQRGDTFLTTQPQWRGRNGAVRDGYVWLGVAGKVFPHREGEAPPPDTQPIYSWWNPTLQDNLLSKGPQLPADVPGRSGYRRYRLEGHVFIRGHSGTLPLLLSYDPGRGDGAARTPALPATINGASITGGARGSRAIDLASYGINRSNESVGGFVFSDGARSPYLERQLGYDNIPGSIEGDIPVVTFIQTFDGVPASASSTELLDFIFNENSTSMASYIRRVSGGRVRIRNAGVIGPLTIADDPATLPDESNLNCWTYADRGTDAIAQLQRLCPNYAGVNGNQEDFVLRATAKAIDDNIDLSRFDRNRNGRLDRGEVVFISLRATPPRPLRGSSRFPRTGIGGGSARDFRLNRPGGLRNALSVPALDDEPATSALAGVTDTTRLSTLTHEMLHVISGFIDIYGSNCFNARASLMGGCVEGTNLDRDRGLWDLDPWHKMRAGWSRPIVREIHASTPPSLIKMTAPGASSSGRDYNPYVFFHPNFGTQRLIMMESRRRLGTDTETLDDGVAVWEVRTRPGVTDNDPRRIVPVVVGGQSQSTDGRTCTEDFDTADRQLWLLSPQERESGCRVRRGFGPFFTKDDGVQSLVFTPARFPRLRRGTTAPMSTQYPSTDLSLEVLGGGDCQTSHCGHFAIVRHNDNQIFEPRLDGWFVDRGGNLVLTGEFGERTRQARVSIIRQGAPAFEAGTLLRPQIVRWTPTQITLLDTGAQQGGTYSLQVINGVAGRGLSNQVIYFPISSVQ